ncbi:MAG: dihydroorotase [Alphaproteobacteria bacterium]|nr:dihydroorotase [Alphaproteobacteria bacterium]
MTGPRFDLLVRGGTAVTPAGTAAADIGITAGRIAAIGDLARASAAEIFDAAGLHVLPGVIDTQVHFREPGNEHKEDLATGTLSAVLGGVTSIFEMPNTNPSTLSAADLGDKLRRAAGRAWCDHAFFMGAAADNADRLGQLERLPGCCGVKIFMGSSTGGLLVEDDATLARVLAGGSRRVAVHAEDEPRLRQRKQLAEDGRHARLHPVWRDEETALNATKRLLTLARQARRRVHVLHITTAEEMEFLAQHRDLATVEVTPQHLTLAAPDCYDRLGNFAQMNPPIRDARHRDALWRALASGIVDVIGSDHAPHTRAEKDKPYPQSPSGMPGVQTTVPLMLDHVSAGRLSLERLVDLLCHGPQRIYQIAAKGRLMVGYDGDLTIVDLKAKRVIEEKWIASRSGWSPFTGQTVTGWPKTTIIRGRIVMREDQVLGDPGGQPVRFAECL